MRISFAGWEEQAKSDELALGQERGELAAAVTLVGDDLALRARRACVERRHLRPGGVEADLPSGARKQFVLYAQPPIFGSRLVIELVSGDGIVASEQVPIRSRDASVPMVGVIAERPINPLTRLILGAITEAAIDCANSDDFGATAKGYVEGLEAILNGLRPTPPCK